MAPETPRHEKPALVKEDELVHISPKKIHREEHERAQRVKHGTQRLDRRSAYGVSGLPKKSGQGGKYTWNGPLDETSLDDFPVFLDEKDPNYVDEDEAFAVTKPVTTTLPVGKIDS